MNITQLFLADIKGFLREFKMARTAFGLNALNNHRPVIYWLNGKYKPSVKNMEKVYAYMEKYRKEKGKKNAHPV